MADEDDVASLIDRNEVNRSINRFAIDEVVACINQNEVSGSIKKFSRNNFHIWEVPNDDHLLIKRVVRHC
jgi:hypothetical protein